MNNQFDIVGNIYVTTDYSKFKVITGNRMLNRRNLSKLLKSIDEELLVIPIIVNEKMEVCDGQHRLECCRLLKKPVYFIIQEGYGLPQIQRCNSTSSTWVKADYLNMFMESGNENYIDFNNTRNKYGLNVYSLLKISSIIKCQTLSAINHSFENGTYVFDEATKLGVESFLDALEDFAEYLPKAYKSKSFISAFTKLYTQPNYKHTTMQSKLKNRGFVLKQMGHENAYLEALCNDIYSFNTTNNGNAIRFINGKFIV